MVMGMVAGILVGHGDLPRAFLKTIESIIGTPDNFQIVSNEQCSLNELKSRIESAIRALGNQDIIIFVDIFGGSCANVSKALRKQPSQQQLGIICGVSLPMLIKYFQYRERLNFKELLQLLEKTGKDEIRILTST
jgi:mannose/fructose-specific phosphotransferase system component IIA